MSNKDQGNDAFRAKSFETAIEFYTEAIKENPQDHTIFGNRAAAYHNL
jgi:stress-induced-phosphoprotein 1